MGEFKVGLARIIHRLSSRSGGSAGGSALRHVATKTPAGVLVSTLRRLGAPALRVTQSGQMIPALQQTVYE